jgi:hypothetical protein
LVSEGGNDPNNHLTTTNFYADISTVVLGSSGPLHVLNCTSLAPGDCSTLRFVHDTDSASQIELASSLSQLKSTSVVSDDRSIRPRTDRASEIELASSLSQLRSASTESESFSENESDFSDNVSIDSDHSSNSYRAFDKTTIGRVNKSIYQLDKTLNQPTLEHLKFYYTNANSLNNKMSSLDALASTSNPTIIAISETWFNQKSNTHLHGYSPFLKNRNGHGGGVALYISEEIESFEIHNPELENQEVEQIWCGIRVGDEKFLIDCVYRPPPKQAEEKETRNDLELALIRSIKSAASEVSTGRFDGLCVFGDFNFTKFAWDEDGTTHISGGLSPTETSLTR